MYHGSGNQLYLKVCTIWQNIYELSPEKNKYLSNDFACQNAFYTDILASQSEVMGLLKAEIFPNRWVVQ